MYLGVNCIYINKRKVNTVEHNTDYLAIPFTLLNRIDITQTEKIILALFGNEVCTLTVKEIADKIGLVPFAVSKAIKNLEKDDEIEVIKTKTKTNTLRYNYKGKGV